jgi:molecular chaperone HscA
MLLEIFDPKAPPRAIGIDLGTTHSLVAYVRDGQPEVVADCDGERLLPSVVHYDEHGQALVGRGAKALAVEHPRETLVSVKRFMGRGADDAETRVRSPYTFAPQEAGGPNTVRFALRGKTVTPVEASAEILRTLKRLAEDEIRTVGGAVITVPAYFDDAQRQATKDAGRLAGLEVLRLLNEPTAAALAYGLDKKVNGTFAVYDLGGGTFDITVLVLDDGVFQVKATGGDSALGGDDFDRAIAEDLIGDLGLDAARAGEPAVVRALLDAARALKHGLTERDEATVADPTGSGAGSELRYTRARLDARIAPLIARTGVACRRALRDAGLEAAELDGVILVGGSTRVPAVKRFVAEVFGREALADIDPDQVVALGAAVQADQLSGQGQNEVLLLDVLPLSLGIAVGGGVVDKVLPRNTTIPTTARGAYTTQEDKQTGFDIHVVQGERELAGDNRSLARFLLKGIPPMAAGLAKLEVTFAVDADGLLTVHAREATTGIEQVVEVKPSYGLDDETVERMLLEAIDHGEEDLAARRLAEERMEAHRLRSATKKAIDTDAQLLEAGEQVAIEGALAEVDAAAAGVDPTRIHAALDALDRASKPFAQRRMDRAIAQAIRGRAIDDVAANVTTPGPGSDPNGNGPGSDPNGNGPGSDPKGNGPGSDFNGTEGSVPEGARH